MEELTLGGLCSGVGALDLAVAGFFNAGHRWVAEHEPATKKNPSPRNSAAKVLAYRFPGVPNLGDITVRDWATVEPVDVVCAGYPCQPESAAGKQLSIKDDRWIWPHYLEAIKALRPRWAVGENVDGHVRRGLRYVISDLQDAGYSVVWVTVRASDVGACHRRARVVWLAWPSEFGEPVVSGREVARLEGGSWMVPDLFGGAPVREWPYNGVAYNGVAYNGVAYNGVAYNGAPAPELLPTPDATHGRKTTRTGLLLPGVAESLALLKTPTAQLGVNGGSQHPDKRRAGGHGPTLADQIEHLLPTPTPTVTDSAGGRNATSARNNPGSSHHSGTTLTDAVWQPDKWDKYGPAIRRHEEAFGAEAPNPTGPYGKDGAQRLCPRFEEWMMVWPEGWVTDVPGISRTDAMKCIGNGVVIPQITYALGRLLMSAPVDRLEVDRGFHVG